MGLVPVRCNHGGTALTTIPDLLLEHQIPMLKFARRITRSLADAEDALQTACITALSSVTDPDAIDNPSSWLMGHVLNAHRSAYRKQARYEPGGDEIAATTTVDGGQEAAVDLGKAMSVIASMKPQHREAFVRVVIDGETNEEVGRAIGLTPQAVSYQVKKARQGIIAGAPVVDGRSLRYKQAA